MIADMHAMGRKKVARQLEAAELGVPVRKAAGLTMTDKVVLR